MSMGKTQDIVSQIKNKYIGIAVAFINHFLWLKYSIIIAILILLIVKRNTVINIVKDMSGKEK